MDETTKTKQGGTTSAGGEGSTSEQETPTLTESQAKVRETKARSDALAEVGRLRKAAEESHQIAQDVVRRLQEREEADFKRDEESAKDDPDKLSALRLRREASRKIAEADEKTKQAEAKEAEVQTQRQEILAFNAERLADKYNVSFEVLLKYGGGTKAAMEELAKSYGERTEPEGRTETSATRMTEAPDRGKTKGGTKGGRKPTLEEVRAATPEEFDAKVKSGEWAPF